MANRYLTLIRHAEAELGDSGDDFGRALSERGLEETRDLGLMLSSLVFSPDRILISAALRGRQTAHELAESLAWTQSMIHFREDLYLADREGLLFYLQELDPGTRHALILGHNPGLSEIRDHLSSDRGPDLSTCGVVHLELRVDSWTQVGMGCGRIVRVDQLYGE